MKFRFYAFKLSLLVILFFVLQIIFPIFTDFLVLDFRAFGENWGFLSSIFLHGGLGHLAYNLFALLLFGSVLAKVIGGKKFLLVFFYRGRVIRRGKIEKREKVRFREREVRDWEDRYFR